MVRGDLASGLGVPKQDLRSAPLAVVHLGLETPTTRPSGLNRYLYDLMRALEQEGVKTTATVAGAEAVDASSGLYNVVASPDDPLLWRLLRLWLAGWEVDSGAVLDAHFALYALGPVLAGRSRHQPVVVHFHGPWADESRAAGGSPNVSRAKAFIERAVYQRAQACVVLSAAFGELLNERYGVPPWSIAEIAPAVDLERFHPGPSAAARALLGVPGQAWMGFAARRLLPRMGLDVLLEAWAEVAARVDRPVLLLVAGDGPERAALERRAAAPDLVGRVRMLGRVDDQRLEACYRAADVSVVPSVSLEGFGLVVLESLACGTPVIGTDTGGLPEALRSVAADLVVPKGEPNALADRLVGAIEGTLPLPSADRCRGRAEGFSMTELARRHIELYTSVQVQSRRGNRDRRFEKTRRTRVVFLDHTARLSGGELAMARLLPALEDVDFHVVLGEDGPLVQRLRNSGVSVEVLPMSGRTRTMKKEKVSPSAAALGPALFAGLYVARLTARLRQLNPDIVHTNSLKSALYGGLASQAAGIPCLWHIRDRLEPDYLPTAAISLMRRCARILPRYVLANSKTTLASLDLPIGCGGVVPSPIDIPWTEPTRRTDQLHIGMLGRIAPWKGQDLFLRAFAKAFPAGSNQAVITGAPLFGEEGYLDEVKVLAADLGIMDRVTFQGFQSDVAGVLASLDVLVHASRTPEPFGQVVVEGMAAGLPVIAAQAGGPAEVITPEVDGLLFPPGDVDALARAIQTAAESPELRQSLGDRARVSSAAYRPDVVAARMREIYAKVA